ncbi:hypothetical protein [Rhodopseudomonas palustris]|uniref:hypothetical protein n=1 Tax=Rhodopseudomonas palustris TaxID=1076 RepID=UPI001F3B819A|nr:hypothetical protein [Rhodopseudomonas palustris]
MIALERRRPITQHDGQRAVLLANGVAADSRSGKPFASMALCQSDIEFSFWSDST